MTASRPMILIGTLQGLALWWLWHATDNQLWPAHQPLWLGACLWIALFVPALYYLSENALQGRRRRLLLLGGTLFYGLVGSYAGWMGEPLEESRRLAAWLGGSSPGQWLGAMAISFMAVPLLAAGRHYPQLFQISWRNALLLATVTALTGIFWIVLYAGATLMKSLGLRFFITLIEQPIFYFPITGIVVATVFAQGHTRASTLEAVRNFWLSLNSWLLPLLLLFGLMWVIALPLTGLEPLLATRSAALFLLWFAALSINFINCAWHDGQTPPPYPRWLATGLGAAWLTLPVVVAVAGWALWLRIHQYGWTEDRVWAALVWLLAALYSLGYARSLLPLGHRQRPWMHRLGSTNIQVAVLSLLLFACLITPVADPRRLAVNSQTARLMAGAVAPDAFDYDYLRWQSGRWGLRALTRLAALEGDDNARNIASRATQSLAQQQRYGEQAPPPDEESLSQRLQVLDATGQPTTLPDSLHAFLMAREPQAGSASLCLSPRYRCLIWLQDLDQDGHTEAILLAGQRDQGITGTVLSTRDGLWLPVATFHSRLNLDQWQHAVEQQQVTLSAPRWPVLTVETEQINLHPQQ